MSDASHRGSASRPGIPLSIGAGFVLFVAVLAIDGLISAASLRTLADNHQWVAHTREVLTTLEETLSALAEAESGQRGFLITGDERYLEPYQRGVGRIPGLIGELKTLSADNPKQQARIPRLERETAAKLDFMKTVIDLKREGRSETATELLTQGRGREIMDQVREVIAAMKAEEDRLLIDRNLATTTALFRTTVTIAVACLLAIALLGMIFYLMRRDLRERELAERSLLRAHAELEGRVRERTADLARANRILESEVRERLQAEEALRASEEQFRTLVTGVKDYAIIMLDPGGNVFSWNSGAEVIKGYRAEEIIGRHFSCFYTDEDRRRGHPAWELKVAAEEGRYEDEGWRVRKDGTRFWSNLILTALRDGEGRLIGFAKITRDITERRKVDERLKAFAARLERSNLELQEFASVAAHDLQEPLRKIQAFGDRLERKSAEALGDQGRDYLERMLAAAGRMRALIDSLLSYSRVTRQVRPLAPVDLGLVAREVMADLEGRIEQDGGRVELGTLPTIDADPTLMRQLLQNLIGNALKFHRPGEPPLVEVRERPLPCPPDQAGGSPGVSTCRFEVRDNGIGIEEKYLDRIFGVFQRLHGRGEFEGTGIGLAICRKIVERHGGTIDVESTPGVGTAFVVTLPAHQDAKEEEP